MHDKPIELFLQSAEFAVIGASSNRQKYGNMVLRCYLQHRLTAHPVHPHELLIEGVTVFPSIMSLPSEVKSISIITPPPITEKIVKEAIKKGIKNIWVQPGAESEQAIKNCLKQGINLIANGPCILVALGFHH